MGVPRRSVIEDCVLVAWVGTAFRPPEKFRDRAKVPIEAMETQQAGHGPAIEYRS